ncbi:hypothetical protein ACWCQK_34565 [Streptomyces sp. NPDC002306]
MHARSGDDYDDDGPGSSLWDKAQGAGDEVGVGRYPLLYVPDAWDVWSMLELTVPGVEHRRERTDNGRTCWMLHQDGSWARATASGRLDRPAVHQGGPRRLWDELEAIRDRLNTVGSLPVYGAEATITRGAWTAVL